MDGDIEGNHHTRRRETSKKTNIEDATTCEKKKRQEMDGLCQPRHGSYRDNRR